jgi:hypothetical protein
VGQDATLWRRPQGRYSRVKSVGKEHGLKAALNFGGVRVFYYEGVLCDFAYVFLRVHLQCGESQCMYHTAQPKLPCAYVSLNIHHVGR